MLLTLVVSAHAMDAQTLHARLQALDSRRVANGAPMPTLSDVQRSLAGETVVRAISVEGHKAHKGVGIRVYDHPIVEVWRAVTDTAHLTPHTAIEESVNIGGTVRQHGRFTYQRLPLPLVNDRWWLIETQYNAAIFTETNGQVWETAWHDRTSDKALLGRVSPALQQAGIPVAFAHGSWLLVDIGGKTWAQNYVWTDPGGALPKAATNHFAIGAVGKVLDTIERFMQEHLPTCSAIFYKPDGQRL